MYLLHYFLMGPLTAPLGAQLYTYQAPALQRNRQSVMIPVPIKCGRQQMQWVRQRPFQATSFNECYTHLVTRFVTLFHSYSNSSISAHSHSSPVAEVHIG